MSAPDTVYEDEHEAFSASRSADYVYVPSSPKYFKKLEQHVDSEEHDIKLPLVVISESGLGKSAMLANWMQRRAANMHRDDFLFKHFVGSSTASCQLSDMLFRLESALKVHFHLREMEVPETEDRLRWSLSRYLAAAAKKAYPAHLVIVIDGINGLKSENSPDGALHWLPTELPSNVRFIVSTVVFGLDEEEVNNNSNGGQGGGQEGEGGSAGGSYHPMAADMVHRNRTYTELQRRKCPVLQMEPLGVNVRHRVIDEFIKKSGSALSLDEKQHFRIVTARATSQPLFLRMLLYALKLGGELAELSIDEQLDLYLNKHDTTTGLIGEILVFSTSYVDGTEVPGLLGRVLSAVYVSRNGLTDEEIWGSVELAMGQKLQSTHLDPIFRLLKDVTIVVNGLRTFSHEAFRRVVYERYIETPEQHLRMHETMARYFNRFTSSDRKLDCLAYHLEVSGSWNKLRNALVDVENFRIWWTGKDARHKKEFIALWASLTNRKDQNAYARRLVTGEFDEATMRHTQTPRPYFDVVEEYTRSLEEYRDKTHPTDEQMGEVVLHIADFLLEFAALRHEEAADVPNFIHPMVPNEDLGSLGVPYLSVDVGGNMCLMKPDLEVKSLEDEGKAMQQETAGGKTNEEMPTISTYFYYRWMWIQFPFVALANCGQRYLQGMEVQCRKLYENPRLHAQLLAEGGSGPKGGKGKWGGNKGDSGGGMSLVPRTQTAPGGSRASAAERHQRSEAERVEPMVPAARLSHSLVKMATQPLPHLPIRKPTRIRQPNLPHKKMSENDEVAGAMDRMAQELYQDIKQYRYEHDVLVQQKTMYSQRLLELNNEMTDLTRTYNGSLAILERYRRVKEREQKQSRICDDIRMLNGNLIGVLRMCERHPAVHPSLIRELENKLKQDEELIAEIKDRIWEETFENQAYEIDYPKLRAAIQETMILHHEMLMSRYRMRENLARASDANLRMLSRGLTRDQDGFMLTEHHSKTSKDSHTGPIGHGQGLRGAGQLVGHAAAPHHRSSHSGDRKVSAVTESRLNRWVGASLVIYAKTGISEVGLFFHKFSNCDVLAEQMTEMKKSAERKLAELRGEQQRVEKELYDMRNSVTDAPVTVNAANKPAAADEADSMEQQMRKTYVEFKRARENATAAANLEQRAKAGLKHVAEILGIQQTDLTAPVHEIVHQIEAVLDILQEETERHHQQKLADPHGNKTLKQLSDNAQSRPHELEEALKAFDTPKARIPVRLMNRAVPEEEIWLEDEYLDGAQGVMDARRDMKAKSRQSIRAEQKKQAKLQASKAPQAH